MAFYDQRTQRTYATSSPGPEVAEKYPSDIRSLPQYCGFAFAVH